MRPTRREFIIASTTAICAVSTVRDSLIAASAPPGSTPAMCESFLLQGDPYTAHVDEHGLGGRSWDAAFEHAQRFRSTADERDRYVLGWEV